MNQPERPMPGDRTARKPYRTFRTTGKKWLQGLGAGALMCALVTGCGSSDDASPAKPTPTVTVTATVTATPAAMTSQVDKVLGAATGAAERHGYRVSAHDASDKDAAPGDDWKVCFEKVTFAAVDYGAVAADAPCPRTDGRPIPWPPMPRAVGGTYAHAVDAVGKVTSGEITVKASYKDEDVDDSSSTDGTYDDWKVCFQSPSAGTRVVGDRDVTLWLTEDGCPAAKGTYKDRTNDPDYTPPAQADAGSGGTSGGSSAGSSGTGGGAGTTCEIVSNAGNCYDAGQFCRNSDVGSSTHAANGRMIYCRDEGSRNRWNY
ncbi:hypothetical protein [Streptomyces sp. NPDC005573]|uniref:hypothetical protein n=1 Tax=Streptomyces sp. NPDC005573 TaxID=3156890 RepID=UPI0033BE32D8